MRNSLIAIAASLLLLSISACKDDTAPEENDTTPFGHFSYYGLIIGSNPSIYTKSEELVTYDNFWSEITETDSSQRLKIYAGDQYNNLEVYLTYRGVGNYSSLDSDLSCVSNSYNGFDNPSYTLDPRTPGTGGSMEILSLENGIITGNLRFIVGRWVQESGSYTYRGIDDCTFEIKLK
jgi:hypothetical protein